MLSSKKFISFSLKSILLKKASLNLNLKHLSMGMSTDYENAVLNGSTFLRIGTAILGERNNLTN